MGILSDISSTEESDRLSLEQIQKQQDAQVATPPVEEITDAVTRQAATTAVEAASQFTGEIDNPVGQLLEDGAVGLRDWIDNTFQGDKLSQDEIREDRNEARAGAQRRQAAYKQEVANDDSLQAEIRKATFGDRKSVV